MSATECHRLCRTDYSVEYEGPNPLSILIAVNENRSPFSRLIISEVTENFISLVIEGLDKNCIKDIRASASRLAKKNIVSFAVN